MSKNVGVYTKFSKVIHKFNDQYGINNLHAILIFLFVAENPNILTGVLKKEFKYLTHPSFNRYLQDLTDTKYNGNPGPGLINRVRRGKEYAHVRTKKGMHAYNAIKRMLG